MSGLLGYVRNAVGAAGNGSMKATLCAWAWAMGLPTAVAIGISAMLASASPARAQEGPKVGNIVLEGRLAEKPGPFDWLMAQDAEPTLRGVLKALDEAASRSDLDGVLIRLKDAELSTAQIEELSAAIAQVRKAGRNVAVFSEAYGTGELLLGASADQALIQTGGPVSLPGIAMEEMFLADMLAWAGVKAELIQVGDYKGANEMFMNSAPSPAWEQNITQLLDSMYGDIRAKIRAGRNMSDEQLDAAMKTAWMADDREAVQAKLLDASVDLPDLRGHLGRTVSRRESSPAATLDDLTTSLTQGQKVDMANPFAVFSLLSRKPSHKPTRPTIAVLHIDGAIVDGDSSPGGMFGEPTAGSRTLRNALEQLRNEPLVRGVVVRIDSPGGSATASEVIWQGLRRVAERKPVWVSVGSMAASGGYYIAVGGQRIYVNRASIVGSIGVVGGKFSMAGLYDTLRIRVVTRSRGPMGSMFDSTRPWSPQQQATVRGKMQRIYDLFAARVTAGRPGIDLGKTAEGRLFTGEKAVEQKMADRIGGLNQAIGDLAAELSLQGYDVMDYPAPKAFDELFDELFKGFVASPRVGAGVLAQGGGLMGGLMGAGQAGVGVGAGAGGTPLLAALVAAGREVVGPAAWPGVARGLEALSQLRNQPAVLAMPRVLIVR